MKKNLLIIIALMIVVLVGVLYFVFFNSPEPENEVSGTILFYGEGCSHCKNVDDFILANKVEEKIKFTKLEVFNNQYNAELMAGKANVCGLPTDKIGVPFLWDGSKCILGDADIIKFFQSRIGIWQ